MRFTKEEIKVQKHCAKSQFLRWIWAILPFTDEEAEVRKQAHLFVPTRNIRTFDVKSEVNCLLLRRKQRIEIIALHTITDVILEVNGDLLRRRPKLKKSAFMLSSTLYPTSWSVFRARKAPFSTFLWVIHLKKSWAYFKNFAFLSFNWGADLRRSRPV